ncbi:MAG: KpsF/GutQ family sugar-phosphate isomerase [Deltaproteobacteria bacterium]|nr:KpsF/GutQ family sugar-phosphate isomerase [Deltaproteobacteria bacterium]
MSSDPERVSPDPGDRVRYAEQVLRTESEVIGAVIGELDESFDAVVDVILACEGRVVVAGMGKPGFVAQKLSATLASTGTPSLYLHPAEALHGDLGRVVPADVLLILSHSGETDEALQLLRAVRRVGIVAVVALTGERSSTLARGADHVLSIGRVSEACPLGLAPTASSIALLALADALAMTVLEARGFDREAYARLHPGGSLGRKLMKVEEIMRQGEALPLVDASAPLSAALGVMTRTPGRPGAALIVGEDGRLAGIFTDGDLRRLVEAGEVDFERPVAAVMGAHPRCTSPGAPVEEAAALLSEARVDQLPVTDAEGRPVGLLDVQDLLAARIL